MPRLADQIAAHERTLEDAELYAREPKRFEATMAALVRTRAELASAEEEWLALEEKREALEAAR
jgi:ATP-binding cassette subfamily F protein uup